LWKAFSMKRLAAVTAVAVIFAATIGTAFAEEKHPPAPVSPAPAPSPWSGFHIGLNGGYAWDPNVYTAAYPVISGIDMLQTDPIPFGFGGAYSGITHGGASALSATGTSKPNVNGFLGGGQVGYDHQFGASFVAGIEGDIQGAGVRGHGAFTGLASTTFSDPASCDPAIKICTDVVGSSVQNEKSVDWLGTARGRFGYLVTPTLLVYATGGLAYGEVKASTSITQKWGGNEYGPSLISPGAAGSISETRAGWTLGGGLEWMFWGNWSAKVEYLYYDLGNVQFTSSPLTTILPIPPSFMLPNAYNVAIPITHTRFDGSIFRVGLNYHF
jgi:outer membrane immunogenic protein